MTKKTLTPKEWKELEESIQSRQNHTLKIDGYDITIALVRNGLKLQYMVYVNGRFKVEWMGLAEDKEPTDECKKFFWKRTTHAARKYLKGASRSIRKKYDIEYTFYQPNYSSFRTLRKTLESNNESIEWIRD